jgi:hypothetical protein
MISSKDLIIGYVTTRGIVNKKKKIILPGSTFSVIEIVQVNGITCYVTNKIHKIYRDGTYEPLIILENLVKEFRVLP